MDLNISIRKDFMAVGTQQIVIFATNPLTGSKNAISRKTGRKLRDRIGGK